MILVLLCNVILLVNSFCSSWKKVDNLATSCILIQIFGRGRNHLRFYLHCAISCVYVKTFFVCKENIADELKQPWRRGKNILDGNRSSSAFLFHLFSVLGPGSLQTQPWLGTGSMQAQLIFQLLNIIHDGYISKWFK